MAIGWIATSLGCMAPAKPGGCTRGGSAERFETPLVGGAARFWRRGGHPPAPAFPRRGKRERGRFKFLAAAGNSRRRPTLKLSLRRSSPQVLIATRKPEFPLFVESIQLLFSVLLQLKVPSIQAKN